LAELKLVMAGDNAENAACTLIVALGAGSGAVQQRLVSEAPPEERRVIDLISLATLILTVPPAVLAVMDIVDRIKKRGTAKAAIDAAKAVRAEQLVDVYLLTAGGQHALLSQFAPDDLLDEVAKLQPPGEAG